MDAFLVAMDAILAKKKLKMLKKFCSAVHSQMLLIRKEQRVELVFKVVSDLLKP